MLFLKHFLICTVHTTAALTFNFQEFSESSCILGYFKQFKGEYRSYIMLLEPYRTTKLYILRISPRKN